MRQEENRPQCCCCKMPIMSAQQVCPSLSNMNGWCTKELGVTSPIVPTKERMTSEYAPTETRDSWHDGMASPVVETTPKVETLRRNLQNCLNWMKSNPAAGHEHSADGSSSCTGCCIVAEVESALADTRVVPESTQLRKFEAPLREAATPPKMNCEIHAHAKELLEELDSKGLRVSIVERYLESFDKRTCCKNKSLREAATRNSKVTSQSAKLFELSDLGSGRS